MLTDAFLYGYALAITGPVILGGLAMLIGLRRVISACGLVLVGVWALKVFEVSAMLMIGQ